MRRKRSRSAVAVVAPWEETELPLSLKFNLKIRCARTVTWFRAFSIMLLFFHNIKGLLLSRSFIALSNNRGPIQLREKLNSEQDL